MLVLTCYGMTGFGQVRKRLPDPVNLRDHIEYAPSLSADGRTLIFQSSRYGVYVNASGHVPVIVSEGRTQKITTGDMVDFFGVYETSLHASGQWSRPEPIMKINKYGNGTAPVIGGPSISYDGNMLFYFADYNDPKEGFGREDIYYCTRTKNGWSNPVNIGAEINSPGYEGFPSISPDGKRLYFIKDNLVKKAEGEERCYRIMRADLGTDGKWKRPIELPAPVNLDCEKAPRIMADGKTLVYSSIKKKGKGDFDLYYSRFQDDGSWSEPVPLEMINTKRSDQSVAIGPCGDLMYYVSDGDIYTYEIPEALRPFKMATIQGFVTDSITGSPIKTRVVLSDIANSAVITSIDTNPDDGRFTILAPVTGEYSVSVNEKDYRLKSAFVLKPEYEGCKVIIRNLKLNPIKNSAPLPRNDIAILTEAPNITESEAVAAQPQTASTTSEMVVLPQISSPVIEKLTAEQQAEKRISKTETTDSTKKIDIPPAVSSPLPTAHDITVLVRDAESNTTIPDARLSVQLADKELPFHSDKDSYSIKADPGSSLTIRASAKNYQSAEFQLADLRENKRVVLKLLALKPSVVKISILDFVTGLPIPASISISYPNSLPTESVSLRDGKMEKTFTSEGEIEIRAFAEGFTSIAKKIKIDILPGGKIYEFEARLDKITYALALKVIDAETGQVLPKATFNLKDMGNNTVLTFETESDGEIPVPGKGKYEITCLANGYNPHTVQLNIDKEKNEVLFRINKTPKMVKYISVRVTDRYTGEDIAAPITTQEGKSLSNQQMAVYENDKPVLNFQPQGYRPVHHVVSPEEIAAGKVQIGIEKQIYDFDFRALSQANRRPIAGARFNIIDTGSAEKITSRVTDGTVSAQLLPERKYKLNVIAEGFEPFQLTFDPAEALGEKQTRQELLLTPVPVKIESVAATPVKAVATEAFGELKKGKSITLNKIFFDQSSPVLRVESYTELDNLAKVLRDNPTLRIEIRGHTDNTGNFDANVKLSRDRCESVVNYLTEKGINRSRMQYIGKGPVDPLAPNTTEENKKKNRRVEFIVL